MISDVKIQSHVSDRGALGPLRAFMFSNHHQQQVWDSATIVTENHTSVEDLAALAVRVLNDFGICTGAPCAQREKEHRQ